MTVERIGFRSRLDLSTRLGADYYCNICQMRNLMWVMCRLRIAVLVRRKRTTIAAVGGGPQSGSA